MWKRILNRAKEFCDNQAKYLSDNEPFLIGWEMGKAISEELENLNKRLEKIEKRKDK